jgi:hypothetical protein
MISKQVGTKAKAAPAVRLLGVGHSCSQGGALPNLSGTNACTLPTMVDTVDGAHSTASMCQRVVALSEPL